MSLELTATLNVSKTREDELHNIAAVRLGDRIADAVIENMTYFMSTKPTPGRVYDDRLTVRTGLSASTCYELLKLGFKRGGIDGRQVGNRWYVTEEAVRDFEGRRKKQAA